MASIIDNVIPTQRFETIRDLLGVVIATELAKQKTLTTDKLFDAGVWVERSLSFDAGTELPAVNISYKETQYSSKSLTSRLGDNLYTIEVIAKGKETETGRADYSASTQCHKLLGAIAYILSSAEYRFLGLEDNQRFVQEMKVVEIKMYPPDPVYNPIHSGDEMTVTAGRLIVSVKAGEEVSDLQSFEILDIYTDMQIEESEKGYKITIINT